jgi:hypothetical protein
MNNIVEFSSSTTPDAPPSREGFLPKKVQEFQQKIQILGPSTHLSN